LCRRRAWRRWYDAGQRTLNTTMYNLDDLQRITGYSKDQLRDRLGRLRSMFPKDHSRGPKNALLVGDSVLAGLQRAKELESGGVSPSAALSTIRDEVKSLDANNPKRLPQQTKTDAAKDDFIDFLKAQLAAQDSEIKFLRDQIIVSRDQLQTVPARAKAPSLELTRWAALRVALFGQV